MKIYHCITVSFFLIVACAIARSPRAKKIITPSNQEKSTVFFDLTNVVMKENQVGFAKKIGYGILASYAVTHWKSPGYRCLDMLHAMSNHESQKPHITISLKNRTMPRCLVELQEGKKTCAQAKDEIVQGIEHLDAQKFFGSCKEKSLMTNIMILILDPEAVACVIEPIKPTIQLIDKLKSAGHRIGLVANVPKELWATAQNKFPDIIKRFDIIVVSSQVKMVKPEISIFNHLISTHNLNPANCILIDDLEESAAAARSLGMEAIVFDKISHVTKKLKQCGVKI